MAGYYVYVLASKPHGMLFVGLTNNLKKRIKEHRNGLVQGFSSEYNVKILVYHEYFDSYDDAIAKERALKTGKNRNWLIGVIQQANPRWKDLYEDFVPEFN